MISELKALDIATIDQAHAYFNKLSDDSITDLYCESVEFKERYKTAHEFITNEFNRRKDKQIQEAFNK